MGIAKGFELRYKKEYLKNYYKKHIQNDAKPGIDRINVANFNKNLDEYCEMISRKVLEGSYNFVPYKEVLFIKGRNKYPRSISIPAIRDKLVLSIMKDLLHEQFKGMLHSEFVKKKIARVNEEFTSKKYKAFIKIDMKDFYGSLNHDFLLKKVWKKARKTEFVHLLTSAITKPTISQNQNQISVGIQEKGIPQGLPISNVLSDIYMIDFDNKHTQAKNYSYFRYVDDILILCKMKDIDRIYDLVVQELKFDLFLHPHEIDCQTQKTYSGKLRDGFSYLGYEFAYDKITVRRSSRLKIESKIESLFNEYHNNKKNHSFNTFLWKLNLKITGATFNDNTYGWLFYYSQINDETLMYQLDSFVKKLFKRYKLIKKLNRSNIPLKRFVRSYHEIKKNKFGTTYIPNFDEYTKNDKLEVLEICKIRVKNPDEEENIEIAFRTFIKYSMRELEKDRGNIS